MEKENGTALMKPLYLLDDCIISPLGFSTDENIQAIREGRSGLTLQNELLDHPIYAGIILNSKLQAEFKKIGDPEKFTKLEKVIILAIDGALKKNPNVNLAEVALIISTTKGNIDLLKTPLNFPENRLKLSELGSVIADFFGIKGTPIVLSNACVSGGLALSVARRLIDAKKFKTAIVAGGDLVNDFVVSGFNSFQALSEKPCKPFSKDRDGISLGEAAVAILVSSEKPEHQESISLIGDASANDANHISGPSRSGDGLFKSIQLALKEAKVSAQEIDFLSAHGTATIYNDEMEAIAFNRAGLENSPLNSLKGFFGHSLGASALLESIVTKHSMLNDELYASTNFSEIGVSKALNIIEKNENRKIKYTLKTASGFGGSNLALILKKEENQNTDALDEISNSGSENQKNQFIKEWVKIKGGKVIQSGNLIYEASGDMSINDFLKSVYNHLELDYPKFYKMDGLSKLGILGAEILLRNQNISENTALVFSNSASSLETDREYHESTKTFPSPSLFVYTLPNIVLGEISIKYKLQSENAFFVSEAFDEGLIVDYVSSLVTSEKASDVLCGWLDLQNGEYDVFLCLVSSEGTYKFSAENLSKLYHSEND